MGLGPDLKDIGMGIVGTLALGVVAVFLALKLVGLL